MDIGMYVFYFIAEKWYFSTKIYPENREIV